MMQDEARTVLGIETSCDETAAAVVRRQSSGAGTVLSDIVLSQIEEHAAFGGVVPEIAARAHVEALDGVIAAAMNDAGTAPADIDAIAVTGGPGLIGGLIVGMMTAKALAAAWARPLVVVNHLEAHALTARLTEQTDFPYLLLLVSGGHTQTVLVTGVGAYERWGTTIDDALGEAFDKTAKLLGLPYPGGPSVERAAAQGDAKRFRFPRPLAGSERLDFSFSGLKTAVRQAATDLAPLTGQDISDICASFQVAIADTLRDRVGRALVQFRDRFPDMDRPSLVVAGGVAANAHLRAALQELCGEHGFALAVPPAKLCTDNAVMVAWAGAERLAAGLAGDEDPQTMAPRARWPLDEQSQSMIGHGKRGAKA